MNEPLLTIHPLHKRLFGLIKLPPLEVCQMPGSHLKLIIEQQKKIKREKKIKSLLSLSVLYKRELKSSAATV